MVANTLRSVQLADRWTGGTAANAVQDGVVSVTVCKFGNNVVLRLACVVCFYHCRFLTVLYVRTTRFIRISRKHKQQKNV